MISLTCTSCKKSLDIDDAFAGGVCRCQYCGTIQTVPAKPKSASRTGTPGAAAAVATSPQKTLYLRKSAAKPDDSKPAASPAGPSDTTSPASAPARAARAAHPVSAPTEPLESKKNHWMIGLAIGAAAALLIALLAWLAF